MHVVCTESLYTRQSVKIQIPDAVETERPQRDRPAASVIAQQYSSLTFMVWRF